MGRPAVITKERVAEAALQIIDEEGLEALSLHRIANEIGVRGPSLYHHFPDKAAILAQVASLVLGDLDLDREVEGWQEWLVEVAVTFYRRVLEHPRAAAILMQYLPDPLAAPGLGYAARLLADAGIDPSLQALLIEGCEKLVWGWALQRAFMVLQAEPRLSRVGIADRWPELQAALVVAKRRWTDEEMLRAALYAYLHGVLDTADGYCVGEDGSEPSKSVRRRRTEAKVSSG